MSTPWRQTVVDQVKQARAGLLSLLAFTLLLGLVNWLTVNQAVMLYLFYVPVVFAAMKLPRREALGVAGLAAVLVVAYAFFLPGRLQSPATRVLFWAQLIVWGGILVVTAYMVATLKRRIQEALKNLQQAYAGVLAILSRFIQTVDADTEAHCVRVSAWAVRLGKELGLHPSQLEELRVAGLLHDVGKVDISVKLLRKAASLSETEREQIKAHPTNGAALVKPVGGMLSRIADAIECHHEKFDGSGYRGLAGEQIPYVARIIAVADVFDALLSDRPYRKGMAITEGLQSIRAGAGADFDPQIVRALERVVAREGDSAVEQATADVTLEAQASALLQSSPM
ncbi:MAG: HD domain-containing protein [Phycisphaerae bacterium]